MNDFQMYELEKKDALTKLQELRVGNYVSNKGLKIPRLGIEGVDYMQITANGIVKMYEGILILNLIPITEEWLLKFGFEIKEHKNGNELTLEFNYIDGYRDILSATNKGSKEDPLFIWMLKSNYEKCFVLPFKYKNVNQIQNLYYALTGKELTI